MQVAVSVPSCWLTHSPLHSSGSAVLGREPGPLSSVGVGRGQGKGKAGAGVARSHEVACQPGCGCLCSCGACSAGSCVASQAGTESSLGGAGVGLGAEQCCPNSWPKATLCH